MSKVKPVLAWGIFIEGLGLMASTHRIRKDALQDGYLQNWGSHVVRVEIRVVPPKRKVKK